MKEYRVMQLQPLGNNLQWSELFCGSRYACEKFRDGHNSPESLHVTSLTVLTFRRVHGKLRW